MKIDFSFETQYGVFRDALYLEDNNELTEQEINALKQERLDNWLAIIENPPLSEVKILDIDGVLYEEIQMNGQTFLKPVG